MSICRTKRPRLLARREEPPPVQQHALLLAPHWRWASIPTFSGPTALCKAHFRLLALIIYLSAMPEQCVGEQVINKRRAEKPEVRKASREAALREVRFRISHHAWPYQIISRWKKKRIR